MEESKNNQELTNQSQTDEFPNSNTSNITSGTTSGITSDSDATSGSQSEKSEKSEKSSSTASNLGQTPSDEFNKKLNYVQLLCHAGYFMLVCGAVGSVLPLFGTLAFLLFIGLIAGHIYLYSFIKKNRSHPDITVYVSHFKKQIALFLSALLVVYIGAATALFFGLGIIIIVVGSLIIMGLTLLFWVKLWKYKKIMCPWS